MEVAEVDTLEEIMGQVAEEAEHSAREGTVHQALEFPVAVVLVP